VRKVAATDSTVLVTGETGTGKELIVRAIHALSRRKDTVLVKVNCAALPAGVIESELFGHEKGAFTGALTRKVGRFELAHGGTLFLDEVGDLPLELQAKLLRVLQEGEFERVGGTQTLTVDVRLIAATNRDLERAVSEGRFRADLYYRLNVFPIFLPPLRERPQDIPRLARHFAMLYAAKMGKPVGPLSADVLDRLAAYAWPGNVRELQNVIERAVILSSNGRFELPDLLAPPAGGSPRRPLRSLEDVERQHIIATLEETGWRVSGERGAARILGLKRTTLEARMKKLGILRHP
jgi:transcriptional regulator with GAF, ATPase, and Fis domain